MFSPHPRPQCEIESFWEVVREMSRADQRLLLQFATSIPRQPLSGFQSLTPQFCIQKVAPLDIWAGPGQVTRERVMAYNAQYGSSHFKLPSASTCVHLLKLPYYVDKELLREKLLYAIRSNSGFELS